MLIANILAVIGAGLCFLLALLAKRLLWPALMATLLVGGSITACAWLVFGAIFLRAHWVGLCSAFTYAAAGAAIAALATAWVRRRRIRQGETVEERERRKRNRKNSRRIVIVACSAVLLILVAGGVVTRIVLLNRLGKEVNEELNDIRAKGFPLTLDDLNAWYPQPPRGQNAWDPYLKALAVYVDEKGRYKLPPAGEPLPPEKKNLMEAYLADNRETLNFLHQAAAMPMCRSATDFTKVFQGPSPRFGPLGWEDTGAHSFFNTQGLAKLLTAEAVVHADNGNAAGAAEAIVCMLGVGRALGNEAFVTTQGTRMSFQMCAAWWLQFTLSRTALSDEELRRIDDLLKDAVNLDGMTRALAAARCMGSAAFTDRNAGAMYAQSIDEANLRNYAHRKGRVFFSMIMPAISWRLRFLGLLEMDHLVFLRWTKTLLADWQEHACKGGLFDGYWMSQPYPFSDTPMQALASGFSWDFIIELPVSTSNFPLLICEVELARAGIAVERYRNAHGALPSELSELVPAYLPAVLLDPWDRKPLRYRKLDKGYVLYSVGRDGKNDGSSADPSRDFSNITFRVAR